MVIKLGLLFMTLCAAKDFQKALAAGEMREKQDLRCPIKEASYTPHAGSVYGMDCSPYQVCSLRCRGCLWCLLACF